jgi:hypothetical protein
MYRMNLNKESFLKLIETVLYCEANFYMRGKTNENLDARTLGSFLMYWQVR